MQWVVRTPGSPWLPRVTIEPVVARDRRSIRGPEGRSQLPGKKQLIHLLLPETHEQVCGTIESSGFLGAGGTGFPTLFQETHEEYQRTRQSRGLPGRTVGPSRQAGFRSRKTWYPYSSEYFLNRATSFLVMASRVVASGLSAYRSPIEFIFASSGS